MPKKKISGISISLGNGNLIPSSSETNSITLSGGGIAAIIGILLLSISLFIIGASFESKAVVAIALAVVFMPLITFQIKNKFVFGNFYSILYKANHPIAYKTTLVIQVIIWIVGTWAMCSIFK